MKIGVFASSIAKRIFDNFNRTTSGSLGTATTGQTWVASRGVWFANGTLAQSTDAAATSPIATIPFASAATISADINGGGVGLSYWLTDANNWWASVPNYLQNTNIVNVCNATPVTNASNPPSGSCCSTVTSTPGGQVCNAGFTSSTNAAIFCDITGQTGGNTVCDQNYQTLTTTSSFCGSYTTNPGSSVCNQNYATGLSNTSPCCSGATPTTTYSCPSGGSLSGTTCNVAPYSINYSAFGSSAAAICAADGGTYVAPNCNFPGSSYSATATTTYACYTAYSTTPTTYSGYTSTSVVPITYSGYTSYTTQPTQYSCFTSTTPTTVTTYTTQIKMLSSISGTIVTESSSNIVTDSSTLSPVQSLKVVMNNGTVTTTAYSSPGLVAQLGSPLVVTPAIPSTAPSVGIIKTTSNFNQGETLDNFEATI